MSTLRESADKALQRGLNLTGPLAHSQVEQIAEDWFPQVRFHEKERFHPIDVERLFKVPPAVLAAMPEPAREAFLIAINGPLGERRFVPPVVRNGSDVLLHGGDIVTDPDTLRDGTEVLEDGVDDETVYTHGNSVTRSTQFFGASDTVSGVPEPQSGDPRVPRHVPIEVRAEMRFLLETLKHELQEDIPNDALWGRFGVVDLFFNKTLTGPDPGAGFKRDLLAKLITAHEAGDETEQANLIATIPPTSSFNTRAWSAVTNYVFLEYYFVYAYNDYDQYGDWPFVNVHEGDVEGCCVVFERRHLEEFAADPRAFEDIVAHSVITSVHEEYNDNDELKRLPVERERAQSELVVYVAPGSHATYLTAGSHDVLDWEDILTDFPGRAPTWAQVLMVLELKIAIVVLFLLALAEHFVDSEDETSDNGVSIGPGPDPLPGGTAFGKRLIVTPLSRIADAPDGLADLNLYQAALDPPLPAGVDDLAHLARRAYPGIWGASDSTLNYSSPWQNKTTRYFKKFLSSGDIRSEVIL